jgi:hypothetical protein
MHRLILLTIAATLAGCIPAPYGAYYKPSYDGGTSLVRKSACGGMAGPPSVLDFTAPGGLRGTVIADRGYVDRKAPVRPLRITLSVPPGSTLRFLSDEAILLRNGKPISGERRIPSLWREKGLLEIPLESRDASAYELALPDYELDGTVYHFGRIHLDLHRLDGGLEPFNC